MKHYIQKALILLLSLSLSLTLMLFNNSHQVEAAQQSRQRKSQRQRKRKPVEPSPADIAKRREEVHKLMLKGEYHHDGSLELFYIGDITSVPALLQVLKDHPPRKFIDGRAIGMCTFAHALADLKKITNVNAGTTYEEWSAWWEEYQKSKLKRNNPQPDNSIEPERE